MNACILVMVIYADWYIIANYTNRHILYIIDLMHRRRFRVYSSTFWRFSLCTNRFAFFWNISIWDYVPTHSQVQRSRHECKEPLLPRWRYFSRFCTIISGIVNIKKVRSIEADAGRVCSVHGWLWAWHIHKEISIVSLSSTHIFFY